MTLRVTTMTNQVPLRQEEEGEEAVEEKENPVEGVVPWAVCETGCWLPGRRTWLQVSLCNHEVIL
jgi:hypothetical protein